MTTTTNTQDTSRRRREERRKYERVSNVFCVQVMERCAKSTVRLENTQSVNFKIQHSKFRNNNGWLTSKKYQIEKKPCNLIVTHAREACMGFEF